MAEAILYGIAVEVLKNLESRILNEFASTWGFKDQIEELQKTISTIKNVILDAEEKQATANGHAIRGWLDELAMVVYAADDLFDEFNTKASCKQHLVGNQMIEEVHTFFSSSNQIAIALKLSRNLKSIRKKLEVLRKDGADFGFAQHSLQQGSAIKPKRNQTYSSVREEEIIGRDDDTNAILNLLLTSSSSDDEHEQRVLPVISIVGIGGMGKTTIAQLVYNHPLVKEFFQLRLWVCVSDDFDINKITEKTIMSATNSEVPKLGIEQLERRLRREISDKKYLLVLDDVWNEDREKWIKMRDLLNIGRTGSKILVTTRSSRVAKIMCTFPPYELRGLSEEKSWDLFEKMAFEYGEAQKTPSLMDIGKEIVQKCANVPLAIRTLASILYGQDESKWLSLKE